MSTLTLNNIKIDQIYLERGESLTVWMNQAEEGEHDPIQVTFRVLPDGTPKIFTDINHENIHHSHDWYDQK